jgi:hypothetical protein
MFLFSASILYSIRYISSMTFRSFDKSQISRQSSNTKDYDKLKHMITKVLFDADDMITIHKKNMC